MRGTCLIFLGMLLAVDAILCPAGEYSFDDTCNLCPPGTDSPALSDNIIDCTCRLGYMARSDGLTCEPCGEGFFKNITGSGGCFACPFGKTSQIASTLVSQVSQCKCQAGYGLVSSKCSACEIGSYKQGVGDTLCTPCSVTFTTEVPGSISVDNCTCPIHASKKNDVCICKAGAFRNTNRICQQCSFGKYKPGDGNYACTPCAVSYSTVHEGSVHSNDCKCKAGLFKNEDDQCEQFPAKTFNDKVGANGIEGCLDCPYRFFQPSAGQTSCIPLFVNMGVPISQIGRVVGLFVEDKMSCAFISQTNILSDNNTIDERTFTHKTCWGVMTPGHTRSTILPISPVTRRCGDGILNAATEDCDDANTNNGDGCSENCLIEAGFFCQPRSITSNIVDSLLYPSTCCRFKNGPASNTPSCRRCGNRPSPFVGTRFRTRNCDLVDVDECKEGTDGCTALPGGRMCVNHNAIDNNGTSLFSCDCPLGQHFLQGKCIPERFAMKFTLVQGSEIDTTHKKMKLMLAAEANRAMDTKDYSIEMIDVVVHDVTDGVNQHVTCKKIVDSWLDMQRLTSSFDTVRFLESMSVH